MCLLYDELFDWLVQSKNQVKKEVINRFFNLISLETQAGTGKLEFQGPEMRRGRAFQHAGRPETSHE
jgi:hypothetical protein